MKLQSIENVKEWQCSTIIHGLYEALTYWYPIPVTKMATRTVNSPKKSVAETRNLMKQGDEHKINLSFNVQPWNRMLLALFRNSNSSGMHYFTSLIYNPPIFTSHHHKKGYQVSLTSTNLVGRQWHTSCTKGIFSEIQRRGGKSFTIKVINCYTKGPERLEDLFLDIFRNWLDKALSNLI